MDSILVKIKEEKIDEEFIIPEFVTIITTENQNGTGKDTSQVDLYKRVIKQEPDKKPLHKGNDCSTSDTAYIKEEPRTSDWHIKQELKDFDASSADDTDELCPLKNFDIKSEQNSCEDVNNLLLPSTKVIVKEENIAPKAKPKGKKVERKDRTIPVQCPECDMVCCNRRMLKLHMMDHSGSRPYKCDICSKSFKKKSDVIYHKKIHTGERDIHCSVCGKGFIVPSALKAHMRTHSKEQPYICPICGRSFSHSSSVRPHMALHSEDYPFQCAKCGSKFKNKKMLCKHMVNAHSDGSEHGFQCDVCMKFYKSRDSLKMHAKMHMARITATGEKIERHFPCDQCGNVYKHAITLKNHQRMHTNDLYNCSMCDKSYTEKATLRIHLRNHTGETPYECVVCHKKFKRRDSLAYHKTTHTNDRDIQKCDICDKDFICKSTLRVHKNVVHGGHARTKTCRVCGKVCNRKGFFSHMMTHGITVFTCKCRRQFEDEEEFEKHKANKCKDPEFHDLIDKMIPEVATFPVKEEEVEDTQAASEMENGSANISFEDVKVKENKSDDDASMFQTC